MLVLYTLVMFLQVCSTVAVEEERLKRILQRLQVSLGNSHAVSIISYFVCLHWDI